jgi:hypothetical protein
MRHPKSSLPLRYSDGSARVQLPGGARYDVRPDGTKVVQYADGSRRITHADGAVTEIWSVRVFFFFVDSVLT